MSEPRPSPPWLLIILGVAAAVAVPAFLLLDGDSSKWGALFGTVDGKKKLESPESKKGTSLLSDKPSADMGVENLTDAKPISGDHTQTNQAAGWLSKATDKAAKIARNAEEQGERSTVKDFDTKGQVSLKPRQVPRGPLAYLTLTTVNPPSVTVGDGDESMGQTPLNNVPVLVGKHAFRLLDNRGVPRRLEIDFEHGKTTTLLKLDVAALPKWQP